MPFYRFISPNNLRRFLTVDFGEGITAGLNFEGPACKVWGIQAAGTSPLHMYKDNGSSNDRIYLDHHAYIPNYSYLGVVAYIFTTQVSGTLPLYRWYRAGHGHFFTTNYSEGANNGWTYEGVACYVLPN